MFSLSIQKKTILFCCIFACLTTFTYTQESFALSDSNQVSDDTSIIKEEKKSGFFSRILGAVFGKKSATKTIKKTDLRKLSKKLNSIEKRIARVSKQKYNMEHSDRNKSSLNVRSRQLRSVLGRLKNRRNLITKQIATIKKDQDLLTKSRTISVPENIVKSSVKEVGRKPVVENEKNKKTIIDRLFAEVPKKSDKQMVNQELTNTSDKIIPEKTNKETKLANKTPVIIETKEETVKMTTNRKETLMPPNESVKSIVPLEDKEAIEQSSVISANEVVDASNTSTPNKTENQEREMVVDDTTPEIIVGLEDGASIDDMKVLVAKNIKRQDLTRIERNTINDCIAIIGEIGSEKEIAFLSDIKSINRRLSDYYTHNIYYSIWKLKKKVGRNRIETRADFDDAIDYISYIYNYYKTNINENMELYNYEIGFLYEIIVALSNSSFTQESIPLLAKLTEFENKDFVNFVSKIIGKIYSKLDIENSNKIIADFRP